VVFASNVVGHGLQTQAAWVAPQGAPSSPSTPVPSPLHDETQCTFCKSGSAAFAAAPPRAELRIRVDVVRPSPPVGTAALPTWQLSAETARAPPLDLLS